MTTKRTLLGLRIEGIGLDTIKAGGIALYYGDHVPPSDFTEWIPALQSIPASVEDSVDPFAGQWATSSFTFEISASDRMRQLFLHEQTEWVASLVDPVDDSTIAFDVDMITGLPPAHADLYVDDETVVYTYADPILKSLTVTRGVWASTPRSHKAGARVFTKKPYWRDRVVEFFSYDFNTGHYTTRWTGYVNQINTSDDGSVIELEAVSYYSRWVDAETLRAGDLNAGKAALGLTANQLLGRLSSPDGGYAVPDFYDDDTSYASNFDFLVRLGDSITRAKWFSTFNAALMQGNGPLWGSDAWEPQESPYTDPVYPLLVWDRLGASGYVLQPLKSTPRPYHPLVIAKELLSGSLLGRAWALPLGDHLDLGAWDSAISAYPGLVVDQLVLGWDGPYKPFEIVQALLRAYGFYLAPTQEGKLGLGRLASPSLDDYRVRTTLSPYRGLLKWSNPLGGGQSALVAEVGKLPWSDPVEVSINVSGVSTRSAALRERREDQLDLSFVSPNRALEVSTSLAEGAFLLYTRSPILSVMVPDHIVVGGNYDLGAWVQLDDLGGLRNSWLIDRDGQVVDPSTLADRIDFIGQIIARRWDVATSRYELDLLCLAFRSGALARLRGPSGRVADSDPTGSYVSLELNDFLDPSGEDSSSFTVGDEVEVWLRDGKRWAPKSEIKVVTGVSPGGQIDFSSPYGEPVPQGAVLRLADSQRYVNSLITPGFDRSYAYLGNSDSQVLGPDGLEDADIWSALLGL